MNSMRMSVDPCPPNPADLPITATFPKPVFIHGPGSKDGPCDTTARDAQVQELAYKYGRALHPQSADSHEHVAHLHAQLFSAVHSEPCTHGRCALARQAAAKPCVACGQPLGFDEPLFEVDHKFVHEACLYGTSQARPAAA